MALIKCPECGKEISDKAQTCPNCGYPVNQDSGSGTTNGSQNQGNDFGLKCPACFSTNIMVSQKGFSGKKALAGAVALGGIGLLAGNLGKNDLICTCVDCGQKFKPQDSASSKDAELWIDIDRKLRKGDFNDAWRLYKEKKNVKSEAAMNVVEQRLRHIDPENADKIIRKSQTTIIAGGLIAIVVIVCVLISTCA